MYAIVLQLEILLTVSQLSKKIDPIMSKQGRAYERVVATVLHAFDPRATVTQGKWVNGPDGRRELDVLIEGTIEGRSVKGLVECKDFNPKTTGPVGIAFIDALDSKRRDLQADFVLLCSNAGFTADAIRKAKRVGVGVAGVLKKGDPRIRFSVIDEIYTRRVQLGSISLSLRGPEAINLADVLFGEVLWNNIPVGNWILRRIMVLVSANPIVSGSFEVTHKFLQPQVFTWSNGSAIATDLKLSFNLSGGWFSHRVVIDSTSGVYDWIRRRVRMTPGGGDLEYRGMDLQAGTPVERPPDREFLQEKFLQGESEMKMLLLENFEQREPIPELDLFIEPSDLNPFMKDIS